MKKLWLIDISSFFFRSYYAVPSNMTSPKGIPTNALYGTFSMLLRLMEKWQPDYIVSCFDSKAPSFRNQLFPEYKANRGEMPEDLQAQVPLLKKMVKLLGIHSLEREGFEADDLIGSMTEFGRRHKLRVVIVSGDKDFAQLVGEETVLLDTMKSKTYNIEGVKKKWGVYPHQMIDLLALMGDASDNIPGVKGVGPKGALRLLEQYGDLKSIYENIRDIKGSLKNKLEEGKELCFLSKKLVTIRKDLKIPCDLQELVLDVSKENDLKQLLKELGFTSFLKTLYSDRPSKDNATLFSKKTGSEEIREKKSSASKRTQEVSPEADNKTEETKPSVMETSFDFVDSLPPYSSLWLWLEGEKIFIGHGKEMRVFQEENKERLGPLLDSKWIRYLGYDLKKCWKRMNLEKPISSWDLMIAAHLLDSEPSASFERILQKHLNEGEPSGFKEIYQAHKALEKILRKKMEDEGVFKLFQEIEMPLVAVLHKMEKKGILIDSKEVKSQSQELKKDLEKLEQEIYTLAGEEFKINSPKQLAYILFEKLNLPKGRKTKSGFSTDSHTLTKIKSRHSIVSSLLNYRELFKLKATYIEALGSLCDPQTGRIHTSFKQAVTSTGRLSSIQPNLQNIPIRTFRGRQIRKCFKAPRNSLLISADYSQIELRILAHITEDPGLCRAFREDLDVHAVTASEIFHVPLKDVTPDLRSKSKAVNFGIAYGQGAYGLAEFLSVSRGEAKEIIDSYFKKFRKVKDYIESMREEAFKKGYVKTLFGRKRFFRSGEFQNPKTRSLSERAAINAPIQGSASDLVKRAMINLNDSLTIPILSQVHDELLFECPEDSLEMEIPYIRSLMEGAVPLKIPLKVNIAVGKNWEEAHS